MDRVLQVPVGISNRHLHVSEQDLVKIFGKDYQLKHYRDLKQPGQFAAQEKVDMVGPKGTISGVRVLGPTRTQTQVEVSRTDAIKLGIEAPVRDSGDLTDSPGLTIVGPAGSVQLQSGVIIAHRHIHMPADYAAQHNFRDKQMVAVQCSGARALTFANVLIRVSDKFSLEFHVDVDEANAALLNNGDMVAILA